MRLHVLGARRIAGLVLAIVLIASAITMSLSSLSLAYAPLAWGAVALGACMAMAIRWLAWRRGSPLAGLDLPTRARPDVLDGALLAQCAAATTQILVAINLPSPHLYLHRTPGIEALYLSLSAVCGFVVLWLSLGRGDKGRLYAALLSAGLFSSTLYLRAFAVPEAGPIYGPIFALALIAVFSLASLGFIPGLVSRLAPACRTRFTNLLLRPLLWALLVLVSVAIAALFSSSPAQSMGYWFRLASLLALAVVLSLSIHRPQAWRYAAWSVVVIAGLLPTILSVLKLLSMALTFGPLHALAYRWHPTELGGANLVARSVLCTVPLSLALVQGQPTRFGRWLSWGIVGGSAFVMLYTRSWEGFFAWLAALVAYGLLAYSETLKIWWKKSADLGFVRWLVFGVAVPSILVGATAMVRTASVLNPYSFNGRIMHWYGAVLAWRDHLWVGAGPAVESSYTPYAGQVEMWLGTQVTADNPLRVIEINGEALKAHAHNLYLEIGAGTGILGLVAFVGLLVTIVLLGLQVWRRSDGASRFWVAGCVAGIIGALLWGAMDVLVVTPPFFSFPIWALVGLLLAQDRLKDPAPSPVPRVPFPSAYAWGIVVLAVVSVLWPALASSSYASGFHALQEQRWMDARIHLGRAVRMQPLDPLPRQLLAEACLGQGDAACAGLAYERASELKRGYSPYYSQLGWLAWLREDLAQATDYFQKAANVDPGEAWRDGLHADLGLAYVAQGQVAEAVDSFRETLKLNPQMSAASYWRTVQRPDGSLDEILDPVYVAGSTPELEQRILIHLRGAAHADRYVSLADLTGSPVSLDDVLDALEEEYQRARTAHNQEASLLLAALADASSAAHMADRGEQAYRDYQALEPQSAYGYRDLGMLYRLQGREAQAQEMLELAVQTSPNDAASRYNLALVYLDQGMWPAADAMLDTIADQAMTAQFHSHLFDPELYEAQVRLDLEMARPYQALAAQQRATAIRYWPADHLTLADLQRQAGRDQQSAGECLNAAKGLMAAWPRPLAPELWQVGQCFTQAGVTAPSPRTVLLTRGHPLLGNVLLGHIYRAQGQLDQALAAYQRASDARPDEGGPHHFLGETYQALGRPGKAETEYRQAALLDPLESLSLLSLGRLQASQGQTQAALESYRAAVAVNPGWGPAHVVLGNQLLAMGDRDGAAEHYRQAQSVSGDLQEGQVHDFAARLAGAELRSPSPDHLHNDYFAIEGHARRVLFMHPDSSASYAVQVPVDARLAFDIAMAPETWYQPGDGVAFTIYIEPVQVPAASSQLLFTSYIDPKRDAAARRWHPHSIDLSAYAGEMVTLTFETSAGPAGDNRYDWAGWGRPRLLRP